MPYTQGQEHRIIDTLKGEGRYLDIGSYDGKTFSNVRALAERGWEGVCVEPAAHAFAALADDPPPGAKLVNALIGKRTGLASFQYSRDAVSSTSQAHAQKWSGYVNFQPILTVSVTIQDLLREFPGPFRFISIDTESTSQDVLGWLEPHLKRLETEMICVEHDGASVWLPGWRQVFRNAENVILRR